MGLRTYEDSHSSGKRFPGQMLLKPKSKLMQFNISYGKGRAVIRPWGDIVVDADGNASMASWRDKQGNFGTSWFVQDDVCQGWGKDFRFTCFTRCEDEQNWPTGSPLQLLFDEVKYSDRWKHLVERPKGGKGFSPISAPKHCGFLKGLLIEANGKNHAQRPFWGTMCVFSPSARDAFDELVNTRVDAATPAGKFDNDPYGWNAQYVVGDPIGIGCGKVFEFDKESKILGSDETAINVAADGRTGGKGGSEVEGYACRIFPKTPVLPLPIDKIRKYDESFVDALWFMTGKEQIDNLIVRGFGHSCRDLLLYTFGGKGLLPAAYESNKVTVDMGQSKTLDTTAAAKGEPAKPQDEPTTEAAAEAAGINLGEDNPPWGDDEDGDGSPSAPVSVASPATQAAMSTADSIKARLAAASGKKA